MEIGEKTPLQTTEAVLGHILKAGTGEDSDPKGTYARAYSDAFVIVSAAQAVVRAEQNLNHAILAYKNL